MATSSWYIRINWKQLRLPRHWYVVFSRLKTCKVPPQISSAKKKGPPVTKGTLGTKRYTTSGDRLCCNKLSWMQVRLEYLWLEEIGFGIHQHVLRQIAAWCSKEFLRHDAMAKKFEWLGSQIHSQNPSHFQLVQCRLDEIDAPETKKGAGGSSVSWPSAQSIVQEYCWKKSGPTVGKIKKLRLGSNEAKLKNVSQLYAWVW